jgi:stearoyl-CoA desaturase (delta-9 desaturase)
MKSYVPKDDNSTYYIPAVGEAYTGLLGDNFKDKPFLQRLNWLHVPLLLLTPVIALYGILKYPFVWQTWVFAVAYYFFTGLGITAGYHRYFAHRAYKATPLMRFVLIMMGTGAVEGSAYWWSRGHRAHHRHVDTDKDPYAIIKGFWYAHIGWMLVKTDPQRIGYADISDLKVDKLVQWQHKYYLPLAIFMGALLPTLICGFGWNDYAGGYFVAGLARLVFVHHSTFFVNSLAHYAGAATFTDGHTARNSIITALLTLGEGYHNFHHEFPSDYRNGLEWYQYDPTKWFIRSLSHIGLTYDLQRFPMNEIDKGKLQMRQKKLNKEKASIYWGADPASLPVWSKETLASRVASGECLCILDGFAVDLTAWIGQHPGGEKLIRTDLGQDITEKFKGGVYKHSNAARNLAATLRVARIEGYWN